MDILYLIKRLIIKRVYGKVEIEQYRTGEYILTISNGTFRFRQVINYYDIDAIRIDNEKVYYLIDYIIDNYKTEFTKYYIRGVMS